MISKQIFSLNFMFLCSLIEELCTKEVKDKTGCNFNFGYECISSEFLASAKLIKNLSSGDVSFSS